MKFSALSIMALACIAVGLASTAEAKSASAILPASQRASAFRKQPLKHDAYRTSSKAKKQVDETEVDPIASAASCRGGAVSHKDAISGVIIMTLIERITNKLFKSNGISFPSQLGGCMILFAFLLLAQFVSPGLGDTIFDSLSPGAALLSKWLPSLFVPGLAMLPLAPSIGNGFEIGKALSVVVLGFLYSLSTVAYSVLFLRAAQGNLKKGSVKLGGKGIASKPYSEKEFSTLIKSSLVMGALFLGSKFLLDGKHSTPLGTAFFMLATFASFVWGARLPSDFVKVIHPLITSTVVVWGVMHAVALITNTKFLTVLKTYKVGSLDLAKTGAGDLLLFLLGPSVVSFGLAMYSRKKLLKENLLIVLSAGLISSAGGLFGTAAFVRAIKLGGKLGRSVRLSVLSRNVTTALSMAIAEIIGGDISIAATAVVLSGIIGATYGRSILSSMGISDPVTRGLAVGAAGQGLGVASMAGEPDAFPFAAMSMVLTAIMATSLVSVPSIKKSLTKLATGM